MTTNIRTVLLIDDSPAHAQAFSEALLTVKDAPFQGERVTTLAESLERLREKGIWAIFLNLRLPGSEGLEALDKLLDVALGVPIVVLGGSGDEALATEALRRGAKDYLLEGHSEATHLLEPYAIWWSARRPKMRCLQKKLAPKSHLTQSATRS